MAMQPVFTRRRGSKLEESDSEPDVSAAELAAFVVSAPAVSVDSESGLEDSDPEPDLSIAVPVVSAPDVSADSVPHASVAEPVVSAPAVSADSEPDVSVAEPVASAAVVSVVAYESLRLECDQLRAREQQTAQRNVELEARLAAMAPSPLAERCEEHLAGPKSWEDADMQQLEKLIEQAAAKGWDGIREDRHHQMVRVAQQHMTQLQKKVTGMDHGTREVDTQTTTSSAEPWEQGLQDEVTMQACLELEQRAVAIEQRAVELTQAAERAFEMLESTRKDQCASPRVGENGFKTWLKKHATMAEAMRKPTGSAQMKMKMTFKGWQISTALARLERNCCMQPPAEREAGDQLMRNLSTEQDCSSLSASTHVRIEIDTLRVELAVSKEVLDHACREPSGHQEHMQQLRDEIAGQLQLRKKVLGLSSQIHGNDRQQQLLEAQPEPTTSRNFKVQGQHFFIGDEQVESERPADAKAEFYHVGTEGTETVLAVQEEDLDFVAGHHKLMDLEDALDIDKVREWLYMHNEMAIGHLIYAASQHTCEGITHADQKLFAFCRRLRSMRNGECQELTNQTCLMVLEAKKWISSNPITASLMIVGLGGTAYKAKTISGIMKDKARTFISWSQSATTFLRFCGCVLLMTMRLGVSTLVPPTSPAFGIIIQEATPESVKWTAMPFFLAASIIAGAVPYLLDKFLQVFSKKDFMFTTHMWRFTTSWPLTCWTGPVMLKVFHSIGGGKLGASCAVIFAHAAPFMGAQTTIMQRYFLPHPLDAILSQPFGMSEDLISMAMAEAVSDPTLASKSLTVLFAGSNIAQFAIFSGCKDSKALACALLNIAVGVAFAYKVLVDSTQHMFVLVGFQLALQLLAVPILLGDFFACASSQVEATGMQVPLLRDESTSHGADPQGKIKTRRSFVPLLQQAVMDAQDKSSAEKSLVCLQTALHEVQKYNDCNAANALSQSEKGWVATAQDNMKYFLARTSKEALAREGYTLNRLRQFGWTAEQLFDAGFSAGELEEDGILRVSNRDNSAFAYLDTQVGSVTACGSRDDGGDASKVQEQLCEGVKEVVAAWWAFAALKEDGSVISWGDARYGGDASNVREQLREGVKAVAAASYGFAALKEDGSVIAWGSASGVGDMSTVPEPLCGVDSIFAYNNAFVARKADGALLVWGKVDKDQSKQMHVELIRKGFTANKLKQRGWKADYLLKVGFNVAELEAAGMTCIKDGQGIPCAIWDEELGYVTTLDNRHALGEAYTVDCVMDVVAAQKAFAALKEDGSVIAWGDPKCGGDTSEVQEHLRQGVKEVVAIDNAFAALKEDGSVITWGSSEGIGDSWSVQMNLRKDVKKIVPAENAFAALKKDGSVIAWGLADSGGDVSVVRERLREGVKVVVASRRAFAALKDDGSVVAWGHAESGGCEKLEQEQLSQGVMQVVAADYAFAALKEDGSVMSWGSADSGGDASAVHHQLVEGVNSINSRRSGLGFQACKVDGTVVSWGR